jgi:uncharacterized protein YaiI (UPF0178 family)
MNRIIIDGDACPAKILDALVYITGQLSNIGVVFVENNNGTPRPVPPSWCVITVPAEPEAADELILQSADRKDVVVTKDRLLALQLHQKSIAVVSYTGTVMTSLRAHLLTAHPSPRVNRDDKLLTHSGVSWKKLKQKKKWRRKQRNKRFLNDH